MTTKSGPYQIGIACMDVINVGNLIKIPLKKHNQKSIGKSQPLEGT